MQSNWDQRFIEVCLLIAQWSKDPSTKVGAVIADAKNRVLGVGFNGFPRGIADDERLGDKETKYKHVVHAEANSILNSTANIEGATLYVSPLPPCTECSKLIIQSGIKRIVFHIPVKMSSKWEKEWTIAYKMLKEAGLEVKSV